MASISSLPVPVYMDLLRTVIGLLALGLLTLGIGTSSTFAQTELPPESFENVIETAEEEKKPILVEIYASWCPYCQRMQETVYADAAVQDYLDSQFTYVRLNSDTTAGTHRYQNRTFSSKQLATVLGAQGVPTTVFLKPDGTPIARQPGFIKRPTFLTMLRFIGSGAYQTQGFQEFANQSSE